MKAFLKQTLIETVNGFGASAAALSGMVEIDGERLMHLLDPSNPAEPEPSEYSEILSALPATMREEMAQLLKPRFVDAENAGEIVQELEFAQAVVGALADQADDEHLPLVRGLQRHLRRILSNFA